MILFVPVTYFLFLVANVASHPVSTRIRSPDEQSSLVRRLGDSAPHKSAVSLSSRSPTSFSGQLELNFARNQPTHSEAAVAHAKAANAHRSASEKYRNAAAEHTRAGRHVQASYLHGHANKHHDLHQQHINAAQKHHMDHHTPVPAHLQNTQHSIAHAEKSIRKAEASAQLTGYTDKSSRRQQKATSAHDTAANAAHAAMQAHHAAARFHANAAQGHRAANNLFSAEAASRKEDCHFKKGMHYNDLYNKHYNMKNEAVTDENYKQRMSEARKDANMAHLSIVKTGMSIAHY